MYLAYARCVRISSVCRLGIWRIGQKLAELVANTADTRLIRRQADVRSIERLMIKRLRAGVLAMGLYARRMFIDHNRKLPFVIIGEEGPQQRCDPAKGGFEVPARQANSWLTRHPAGYRR